MRRGFARKFAIGIAAAMLPLCAPSLSGQTKSTASPRELASVPFVGCKTYTQTQPLNAPMGTSVSVPIDGEAAGLLAYYKLEQGLGVLAPRGWSCVGFWGTHGDDLYVTPKPLDGTLQDSGGIKGPVILLDRSSDESGFGQYEIAQTVARVFPAHKAIIAQFRNNFPDTVFPSGPYPKDKLKYKGDSLVEYETPPESEGLGTHGYVQRGADPIEGVAMLVGGRPKLVLRRLLLSVRLPSNQQTLAAAIVAQVERDALRFAN